MYADIRRKWLTTNISQWLTAGVNCVLPKTNVNPNHNRVKPFQANCVCVLTVWVVFSYSRTRGTTQAPLCSVFKCEFDTITPRLTAVLCWKLSLYSSTDC